MDTQKVSVAGVQRWIDELATETEARKPRSPASIRKYPTRFAWRLTMQIATPTNEHFQAIVESP